MERQVRMSGDRFIEQMRSEFEQTMRRVAEAVNQVPNGHDSEGKASAMEHPAGVGLRRAQSSRDPRGLPQRRPPDEP